MTIFGLQFEIAYKLQDMQFQTEELKAFRTSLVEHMVSQVQKLNRDNFAVKQHLKYVELYADKNSYNALTYADTLIAREELAPLIEPEPDDPKALRFDALLYGIEIGIPCREALHSWPQRAAEKSESGCERVQYSRD